jgi:hypothetical protein
VEIGKRPEKFWHEGNCPKGERKQRLLMHETFSTGAAFVVQYSWDFPTLYNGKIPSLLKEGILAYLMEKMGWVLAMFLLLQREVSVLCKGIFLQRAEIFLFLKCRAYA